MRLDTYFAKRVGDGLTASNRPNHDKRLSARSNRLRQRRIRRFMGQILLASEKPQERPALQRDVVADRPAQHRIAALKRIQHRALCHRPLDLKLYVTANTGQRSQMMWEQDSNHGSV